MSQPEDKARIAELEAGRDRLQDRFDTLFHTFGNLTAEVTRLTRHLGEATGRIETDGRLIASLEAEVARLTTALQKRRPFSGDLAQKTIDIQVAEIDRLTTALTEATRPDARLERVLTTMEEAAVRNGVALQREAREAMREACAAWHDKQAAEYSISISRALHPTDKQRMQDHHNVHVKSAAAVRALDPPAEETP